MPESRTSSCTRPPRPPLMHVFPSSCTRSRCRRTLTRTRLAPAVIPTRAPVPRAPACTYTGTPTTRRLTCWNAAV